MGRNRSKKLYFVVYKNDEKELHHVIDYKTNKQDIKNELRDKGLVPKGIFSEKDVDKVLTNNFFDNTVPESVLNYVKEHIDYWQKNTLD